MNSIWQPEERRRFRRKFRDDYQFAMVVLFGLLAAAVVSCFVVYRYFIGNYLGGTVNLLIVLSFVLVLVYALKGGNTARAGRFFAVVTVVACIASTAMFGATGVLWGYVVLWVNFLLTERRFALVANLLLIAFLIVETRLFESLVEGATYIITALMVTTFAYIFAERLARYQDQLKNLALQDPLTFAGNRRMMRRDLSAAVASHRRTGRDFTLMLLDLDRFKEINDRHGHDVGDRALRAFADRVRSRIRLEDCLYRFGGEEFVLLWPDHGLEEAEQVARALHRRTSGRLNAGDQVLRFSGGVAVLGEGEDWQAWLRRADRAMYRAKQNGRDRIEMAGPAPGVGQSDPMGD